MPLPRGSLLRSKPHGRSGGDGLGAWSGALRGTASLLLALVAGILLGLDAAIVAQLAQGYPLWGLSGNALGTLLVALPLAAWLCGVLALLTAGHFAGRRGGLVLAQLAAALVSAVAVGALLGFTPWGRYEWLMRNGP